MKLHETIQQAAREAVQGGITAAEFETILRRHYFRQALELSGGNVCRAAHKAQLHRNTFLRAMHQLGIDPEPMRRRARMEAAATRKTVQSVDFIPNQERFSGERRNR